MGPSWKPLFGVKHPWVNSVYPVFEAIWPKLSTNLDVMRPDSRRDMSLLNSPRVRVDLCIHETSQVTNPKEEGLYCLLAMASKPKSDGLHLY